MPLPEGEPQQIFKALQPKQAEVAVSNPELKESGWLKKWFETQWDALGAQEGFGEEVILSEDWAEKLEGEKVWIEVDEAIRRSLAIKTAKAYRLLMQAEADSTLRKRKGEEIKLAEGTISAARNGRKEGFPQLVQLGFEYLLEDEIVKAPQRAVENIELSKPRQEERGRAEKQTTEPIDWANEGWEGDLPEASDLRLQAKLLEAHRYATALNLKDPRSVNSLGRKLDNVTSYASGISGLKADEYKKFVGDIEKIRTIFSGKLLAASAKDESVPEGEEFTPSTDTEKTLAYFGKLKREVSSDVWKQIAAKVTSLKAMGTTFVEFDGYLQTLGVDIAGLDIEALYYSNPFDIEAVIKRMN